MRNLVQKMDKVISLLLLVLFSLSFSTAASGATYYVLDGGSGDGSSWSSPYGDLDDVSLARGDIVYVGDGTYIDDSNGWDLTTAASGDTYITIKKAVEAALGPMWGK